MAQVNLLVLYQHLEEAKKKTRSEPTAHHQVKNPPLTSNDSHTADKNSIFNYRDGHTVCD